MTAIRSEIRKALKTIIGCGILLAIPTIANPALAQYDDSPMGAAAYNTCWYLSKGFNFNTAWSFAVDPTKLLIDQRGVTPPEVRRNGMTILKYNNNLSDQVRQGLSQEQLRETTTVYLKKVFRNVLRICPNSLGQTEYNFIKNDLNKFKF